VKTLKKKFILCIFFCLFFNLTAVYAADDSHEIDLNAIVDANSFKYPKDVNLYPLIDGNNVKNVILLIGDGMGPGIIASARAKAASPGGLLYMERFPVIGIQKNYSANALITDSAAAATALAAGRKTNNQMVGITPDGTKLKTILEAARDNGFKTGLVVTSTITHATPACFASHISNRDDEPEIAGQLIANKVNVLFGGGRQFFLPKNAPGSKRPDNKNLIKQAEDLGYLYIQDANGLKFAKGKYILGLFQLKHLTTQQPEPSLAELTGKAIEVLNEPEKESFVDRDKGFFLMVEGSQIDFAAHLDNLNHTIRQTLLFDRAVKMAVDFALKDKHTLVIVTADHDTGGLTITGGDLTGKHLKVKWTSLDHTGLPIIVYAFGPAAQTFSGTYDNTDIPKKIAYLLGIKNFPQNEK
jgi:alkaline phosphatase